MINPITLLVGPDAHGRSLAAVGDRIVFYGDEPGPEAPDAFVLPCPDGVIEPADVNAHTHLYSGLVPQEMPPPEIPPETFLQILERVWWRLDRALDAPTLRAAARYYIAHGLLSGTGTFIDHHESPGFIEGSLEVVGDAATQLGARAFITYGATERNGGRDEGKRGLRECLRFMQENGREMVDCAVGLHASFTVSDDTIREAGDLARETKTVVHVHMAEDLADVTDARERGYAGPLQRLLALKALPEGSILAHGVHLSEIEVAMARDQGLWLVQNPRSNVGNGVGYPRALAISDRVALGTDGYASDMREEQRALLHEAASHHEPASVVDARLTTGRRLAGERLEVKLDSLEPGNQADVVVRIGRNVQHVAVNGRVLVRDGLLLTGDLAAIEREAREQADRLWKRMADL